MFQRLLKMPRFENAVWKLLQNLGSLKIRTPHLAWYPLCQEILHGHKAGLGRLSSNFWFPRPWFFLFNLLPLSETPSNKYKNWPACHYFPQDSGEIANSSCIYQIPFCKGVFINPADVAHQILPRSPFKAKLCERTEVQSNNARLTVVSGMACFPVLLEFQDGTNIHRCQTRSNASWPHPLWPQKMDSTHPARQGALNLHNRAP